MGDWNSQLSVICNMEKHPMQEVNVKKVDKVLKSLQEDKENMRMPGKKTNVYKIQIPRSDEQNKHTLKSRVIQLLQEHAPSEEIKEILKNKKYQKLNAPLKEYRLPSAQKNKSVKMLKKNQSVDSENELNENAEKDEII